MLMTSKASTEPTTLIDNEKLRSAKKLATVLYALYAAGVFFFIPALVAVIINYVKKDDVKGAWLESHFQWQIYDATLRACS